MKMIIHRTALAAWAAGGLLAVGLPVWADQPESLEELKAKISELDQKVKILERNRELDTEAAEAKTKDSPKITIGDRGIAFASADTNFVFALHGVLQVDNRTFLNDGNAQG